MFVSSLTNIGHIKPIPMRYLRTIGPSDYRTFGLSSSHRTDIAVITTTLEDTTTSIEPTTTEQTTTTYATTTREPTTTEEATTTVMTLSLIHI